MVGSEFEGEFLSLVLQYSTAARAVSKPRQLTPPVVKALRSVRDQLSATAAAAEYSVGNGTALSVDGLKQWLMLTEGSSADDRTLMRDNISTSISCLDSLLAGRLVPPERRTYVAGLLGYVEDCYAQMHDSQLRHIEKTDP